MCVPCNGSPRPPDFPSLFLRTVLEYRTLIFGPFHVPTRSYRFFVYLPPMDFQTPRPPSPTRFLVLFIWYFDICDVSVLFPRLTMTTHQRLGYTFWTRLSRFIFCSRLLVLYAVPRPRQCGTATNFSVCRYLIIDKYMNITGYNKGDRET